jgi:hypothetical protein
MALASIPGVPGGPAPNLKLQQPGTSLAGSIYAQRPTNPSSPYAVPTIPAGFGFTAPPPSLTRQQQFGVKLQGDEALQSQRAALNAQLGGYYGSTSVPAAQAAYINYGGNLGNLDLSRFQGPVDVSGNKIGLSFPEALAQVAGTAQANPYSDLGKVATGLTQANAADLATSGARLGLSGAIAEHQVENEEAARQARYTAGTNFMNTLSGLYSNWTSTLGNAQSTYAQDLQDAADRINDQIKSGWITAVPPGTGIQPGRVNLAPGPGEFGYRGYPFRPGPVARAAPGPTGFRTARQTRLGG